METPLEYILRNNLKGDMIAYLKSHPQDFEEAINLAVSDKPPYSWRASWLLWSCMDENDQRIQKYLDTIIETLPTKKENQQREFLIILQKMDLHDDSVGTIFDHCLTIWKKVEEKPSVRFNAFKLMIKIVKKIPDFKSEVLLLTQPQYLDSLSGTARKSIFKMFASLP